MKNQHKCSSTLSSFGKLAISFSKQMLLRAKVAVSPGVGFGEHGEGYVRFALCENEHRIRQAIRGVKMMLQSPARGRAK